ncbi:hypothetical protein [Streptomyces cucumeris]|uniref:hypothetical protein n=1 Tax=Streptomyces cucumeris TaxID=2962890 RepID=UPI0020C8A932|nr:hypothetical protein [Streptomyces sp. NEAU-Y11]MCP9205536.1 hypothetical protein [Streptomyces sp. NEAU-Y11]
MLDVIAYVAAVVLLTVPLTGCWAHIRRPAARADRQLLHLARTSETREANR